MSVTQAMRFLKQQKIDFEAKEYDHKVKGAEFAAESLNWPLESTVKTLVVSLDKQLLLCLMPGTAELSLKKLARAAGGKAARMATSDEAEKATGYLVGGISPFGTKKRMPVWAHETIPTFDAIGINGGRRGTIVFLDPAPALAAVHAHVADLAS